MHNLCYLKNVLVLFDFFFKTDNESVYMDTIYCFLLRKHIIVDIVVVHFMFSVHII